MAEDIVIVGTGFSAMLAHLWLKDSATVFGASYKTQTQYRNQDFLYNKPLGVKACSYTKLTSNLSYSHLHDRLVQGGNGTIWGGFINVKGLPNEPLQLLKSAGVLLTPLSYDKTGSISTSQDIRQLQSAGGETLNPAAIIKDARHGYLERFEVLADGKLRLCWATQLDPSDGLVGISECHQLVLAVGVVQLLDLLYRSGFLKEQDVVGLSEFKYQLKLVTKISKVEKETNSIRIGILRGLCHYFGIQRYPRVFSFLDHLIPLTFDQRFYFAKAVQLFKIKNGALSDEDFANEISFGGSIHYCNLTINGIEASRFLTGISNRIIGIGMAFVDQETPGPISNDIFKDTVKKIWIEK